MLIVLSKLRASLWRIGIVGIVLSIFYFGSMDLPSFFWPIGVLFSLSINGFIAFLLNKEYAFWNKEREAKLEQLNCEHWQEKNSLLQRCSLLENQLEAQKSKFENCLSDYEKEKALTLLLRNELENFDRQREQLIQDAYEARKEQQAQIEPESLTPQQKDLLGKYTQLREQFSEKSHNLIETRKELFFTETQLMSLEREVQERIYTDQFVNCKPLEQSFEELSCQIIEKEEEIASLEALISHILAQ